MDVLTAPYVYEKGSLTIGDTEYKTTLVNLSGLIYLIRHETAFTDRLERAIQTYRKQPGFKIYELIIEHIYDDPHSETLYLTLSHGDAIVSTCRLTHNLSEHSGYISLVYTSEEFRGKGICQHTIGHLLETTKHGLNRYNLLVDKPNVAAIKCYEKNGFVITGDGEKDTYRMELDMSKAGGAGKRKTRKTRRRR